MGLAIGFMEGTSLRAATKQLNKSQLFMQAGSYEIVQELVEVWIFRVSESKSKYASSNNVTGRGQIMSSSYRMAGPFEYVNDSGAGTTFAGTEAANGGSIYHINENVILLKTAAILSCCIRRHLFTVNQLLSQEMPTLPKRLIYFLGFVSGGGWIPVIGYRSVVDLNPRTLFLKSDPLRLECSVFPCSTSIQMFAGCSGNSAGKPVVLLKGCAGAVNNAKLGVECASSSGSPKNSDGISASFELIPCGNQTLIPATELITLRDPFRYLHLPQIADCFHDSLPTVRQLSVQLREAVAVVSPLAMSEIGAGMSPKSQKKVKYDALTFSMSQIRCLLLQMVQYDAGADGTHQNLFSTLNREFGKILELSAVDYVSAVLSVLETLKLKPGQLDILKNLLREEDISFLEKIALRLWPALRQVQGLRVHHSETNFKYGSSQDKPLCSILSGEVQISDSKVRALNHFPSVRVLDITLRQCTGRWFYECTLLTDGLMQIGWADKSFRCDPVCGQGVGDHPHSWSFDGFRMKKWNVSCENYGSRWRIGDVVGVLIDMDLLEMNFYLNGLDLGVAFSGFHCDAIYPALSMNVRQAVRINYGQHKFIYPPSLVDKIRYRPIHEAAAVTSPAPSSLEKKKEKNAKKNITPKDSKDSFSLDKSAESKEPTQERDIIDQSIGEMSKIDAAALLFLMRREVQEDNSELVDAKGESRTAYAGSDQKSGDEDESIPPTLSRRNRTRLRFSDSEDLAADSTTESKPADPRCMDAGDSDNDDDDSDDDNDASEGSDDEMEDDDDDAMDEEGSGERRTRSSGGRLNNDDSNPELELRRQALIESLIGMVSS